MELVDSLPLEEQEQLIEIERKRIIERKRKLLSQNIIDAQTDIENGNYITGDANEIMKAIDDEIKSDKKI
ncbi:MAG: hypothetical protein ABI528_00540 [bacterium]